MNQGIAAWPVRKLGEICEINPSNMEIAKFSDDTEVSFVPMSAVSENGSLIEVQTRRLGDVRKGYTHFQNGDVLLAKITPCMENGKRWLAKSLVNDIGYGSTEFHVLRPRSEVPSGWIFHFISQQSFREEAATNMTGTAGQKRVPKQYLENVEIPVPPPELQRQIVGTFEDVDSLRSKREQTNQLASRVIQSVFLKMFGDPSNPEDDFPKTGLSDLVESQDSKRIPLNEKQRSRRKGNIPYYGASGLIDRIDDFIFDEPLLLLAEDGENLKSRKLPIAYSIFGKSWVNNHAHVLRCLKIDQRFLEFWFNLIDISPYLSGSTRPKLKKSTLMRIEVPVPSESLQRKFAGIVDKIEQLQNRQHQSTEEIRVLYHSLMQKAFSRHLPLGKTEHQT